MALKTADEYFDSIYDVAPLALQRWMTTNTTQLVKMMDIAIEQATTEQDTGMTIKTETIALEPYSFLRTKPMALKHVLEALVEARRSGYFKVVHSEQFGRGYLFLMRRDRGGSHDIEFYRISVNRETGDVDVFGPF